jgi:hypothetical protein
MKFKLHPLLSIVAILIGSVVTLNAQVKTDYDHSVTFSSYKTNTWLKVQGGDSLWDDRIRTAVDSQLAARGWRVVDSGGDASISAFRSIKQQQTLETFYDGMGGGWRWRGFGNDGMSTTTTDTTKLGILVVDIFDSHTQKLIWRGMDTDTLSSNPEKNSQKLTKDFANMFKHFPETK